MRHRILSCRRHAPPRIRSRGRNVISRVALPLLSQVRASRLAHVTCAKTSVSRRRSSSRLPLTVTPVSLVQPRMSFLLRPASRSLLRSAAVTASSAGGSRSLHHLPPLPSKLTGDRACDPLFTASTLNLLWNDWHKGLLDKLNEQVRGELVLLCAMP